MQDEQLFNSEYFYSIEDDIIIVRELLNKFNC